MEGAIPHIPGIEILGIRFLWELLV